MRTIFHKDLSHILTNNLLASWLIVSMKSIEIDGFGVLETYRHQGVGSTIQAYIGEVAEKPVILVADGEDTAKDMYLKQGYTFLGYRYQILKENI